MKTALGFTSEETIESVKVSTVEELINALELFVAVANNSHPSIINVENSNGDEVILRLIENTLTDGSKTYDIKAV